MSITSRLVAGSGKLAQTIAVLVNAVIASEENAGHDAVRTSRIERVLGA